MSSLSRCARAWGAGSAELPLLWADVTDGGSVRAAAEAARVVITTVGPYIRYGEPLVAACAAAGTDYVDLTGEPEFVDRMWLGYHEQASRSGPRIVHSCGFDSIRITSVLFTVEQLPEGVPIALEGFVRVGGTFSGGTYQSTIEILSRLRQGASVARERRRQEARPFDRRVCGYPARPTTTSSAGAGSSQSPRSTHRPSFVARALERYGPDFAYSHVSGGQATARAGRAGRRRGRPDRAGAAAADPQRAAQAQELGGGSVALSSARNRGSGCGSGREADGRTVHAQVSGGDPGYGETSKMLAESALCLAFDELPQRAGQLTPALAMAYVFARPGPRRAGIKFEVLDG